MIDFSLFKNLSIGGVELKQLYIDNVLIWKQGYKNWVRYSTESDGVTIYNNGLGYKDGYRVRSGGAETVSEYGSCTGYIPVKAGDVIRLSGYSIEAYCSENAINVSDSNYKNIGQIVSNFPEAGYGIFASGMTYAAYSWNSGVKESDDVWKWTVPPAASGIAFIRVTGRTDGMPGSAMIVTVNEEIV